MSDQAVEWRADESSTGDWELPEAAELSHRISNARKARPATIRDQGGLDVNEPVVHGLSIVAGELAGFRDDDWKPTVSTSTAASATTCAECGAAVEGTRKNAIGSVEFAEPCGHRVAPRVLVVDDAQALLHVSPRLIGSRAAVLAGTLAAPAAVPPAPSSLSVQQLADAALACERKWRRSGGRPYLALERRGIAFDKKIQVAPGLRGKNVGHRYPPHVPEPVTVVRVFADEVKRWLRKNARHLLEGHEVLR